MSARPGILAHGAMLLFSAVVAGSFSLGHIIANDIAPAALTALRFMLAAVVMAIWTWRTCGVSRRDLESAWRYLLLGGLMGAYFVLMFEGLKTAPAVSTSAVFTLTPAVSAIFGYLLLSQRINGWVALALSIGGAGAVWVIFQADLGALLAFEIGRGEAIFFFGCVAHAIYTPLVRKLNRDQSPVVFTFGTIAGALVVLLVYGARDLWVTDYSALPPMVWVTLVYLAVFASALSFFLVQYSTLHLPSAKVMAYTYLTPSWVILWEAALGNGFPALVVLAGVFATILALTLLLRDETTSQT